MNTTATNCLPLNDMDTWIFIANPNRFRMNDYLADNGFVEFFQRNKVEVGDVVYLYMTAPYRRIEYKLYVERMNIPLKESVDDRAYSLRKHPLEFKPTDQFVRLRLQERVIDPGLNLSCLYEHGLTGSMQTNKRANKELTDYINSIFESHK